MRKHLRFCVGLVLGETNPKHTTYRFKSVAERRAFLKGMRAAIGYHEFNVLAFWKEK